MLYGRDVERARVRGLLEQARISRSGALVVRGEPGIGKTALLEDTRERAADMHVLSARGVESESELPFAALHQLLRPALEHVDRLPPPQAAALRGALGLTEGSSERFLVFAACLSLLSELAERRPVLCLVDDAHWLDSASADALRFVARRLDAEGIVVLFAAREGEAHAFEAADLPTLTLGGLDAEAAAALLERGAGVDAAPAVRSRLVQQTRGNALALLEVPSVLSRGQLAGDEPLPEALPMTRQVEGVFLERVHRLPEDAQRLLLVAAADESENVALVLRAAAAFGADAEALDRVEHAGLLSVHGLRLEFRHPLVRSAVYESATSTERRAVHRALAEALAGDAEHADRRAWHLASSVLDPDESVVQALEEAAARAESRGGHMGASRALERAAQLSADSRKRGRRLVGAARAASIAGAEDRAVALAKQARPLVDDAVLRAEIARVLGFAEIQRGRPADVVPALIEAATEVAPVDPRKALELLVYASNGASDSGDLVGHLEAARLAETVDVPDGDGWPRFVVDFIAGCASMAAGDPGSGAARLDAALRWVSESDDENAVMWASAGALWVGQDEQVETLAARAASLARARGSLTVLIGALGVRASQFLLSQRFDEAAVAAGEAVELAREVGADNYGLLAQGVIAGVAAVRGDDDEARRLAEDALATATAHGFAIRAASAHRALGWIDLGRGRWVEALEHLDAMLEQGPRRGRPMIALATMPDRVEAAQRAGRLDKAHAALESFEAWAASSGAAWVQPRLASCRALLADGDEATEHFEEARRLIDDARPFDRARIHLLYGEHLRRERRRVDARAELRSALEGFEALRVQPWAERARVELRASGESARKRDPSTAGRLTPQELQIARYAADGLTNKEIAAQLFLSPRTIDSHLRNIYAKLEITSRTQLARFPLEDLGVGVAAEEAATV